MRLGVGFQASRSPAKSGQVRRDPALPPARSAASRSRSTLLSRVFAALAGLGWALALCACGERGGTSAPSAPPPQVLAAQDHLRAGRFDDVVRLMTPHLERHPSDGRAALLLGAALYRQHQYARAMPYLEVAAAARDLGTAAAGAFYYLGWCAYRLGDLDRAEAGFARQLELDPREGDGAFGLGLVAFDRGLLDEAERHFERAIELYRAPEWAHRPESLPQQANAHARLADVLLARDDTRGARDRLRVALNLRPGNATIAHKLAEVLRDLGDEAGAMRVLQEAESARARPSGGGN